MLNTSDPLVKIGITSVVCTVPAVISTAYRLWIRRGRYWADDIWALASVISQLLMFSGSFIHIAHSSPPKTMAAAYYIMAATFYTVVWFARLSILFSVIRIDPSETRRRRLLVVALLFFLTAIVLVAQLWWVCEPMGAIWKHTTIPPQCSLTRQVVILQLVTDILADMILIISPLRLLRTLSDKKLRRRLTVIFSTCLITTSVSLVHAAFIFVHAGHEEVIAAIVEDCVSLIVCNVPVVVTSLLHIKRDVRRPALLSGRSAIRFTSWHPKSTADESLTTTGSIAMPTSDWMSNFRWERELIEDSDAAATTNTTISISSSEDAK